MRIHRQLGLVALLSVAGCEPTSETPLSPQAGRDASPMAAASSSWTPDAAAVEAWVYEEGPEGGMCTVVTFEGRNDFDSVGEVPGGGGAPGLSFPPPWQVLNDRESGGVGPFANAPSGHGAGWIENDDLPPTVVLDAPAVSVRFHYSASLSSIPLLLRALDREGTSLAEAVGTTIGNQWFGAECDEPDSIGWCAWDVLEVTDPEGRIRRVDVLGATVGTFLVDDLTVCGASPAQEPTGELAVDIMPGSDRNPVNPRARGELPVAVLGSAELDVTTLDPSSATLGDGVDEDTPVSVHGGRLMAAIEDVDGDGHDDLLLHFRIAALVANGDLTSESTELILTIQGDGLTLQGSDHVTIVGVR